MENILKQDAFFIPNTFLQGLHNLKFGKNDYPSYSGKGRLGWSELWKVLIFFFLSSFLFEWNEGHETKLNKYMQYNTRKKYLAWNKVHITLSLEIQKMTSGKLFLEICGNCSQLMEHRIIEFLLYYSFFS